MSLLWRDRLLISLAPSEICWLRLSGVLKTTVVAKGMVPVDRDYGAHPWDGAIAALRNEAARWGRERLSVRVVLSNHLVRYALVPTSDQVSGMPKNWRWRAFISTKCMATAAVLGHTSEPRPIGCASVGQCRR